MSTDCYFGIVTPTNSIEMPHRSAVLHERGNATELVVRLERDGSLLRARLLEMLDGMSPREWRLAEHLRRRSELGYRTLIVALMDSSGPAWRPFWRTEPPTRSTAH